MAQDRHFGVPKSLFLRKHTAEQRPNTESLWQIPRYPRSLHTLGRAASCEIEIDALSDQRDLFEQLGLVTPVHPVRRAYANAPPTMCERVRTVVIKRHKALRVVIRQGAQHDAVHQAEDSRGQPDPERQDGAHDRSPSWRLSEHP